MAGTLTGLDRQKNCKKQKDMHSLLAVATISMAIPRILPITLVEARMATLQWMEDVRISDERHEEIRLSERMYRVTSTGDTIGCISLQYDGVIRAVALLEQINTEILVWNIEGGDVESATLLIRAIRRDPKHSFVLSHALRPRWRVAFSFFIAPSSRPPEGPPPPPLPPPPLPPPRP